MLGSVGSEVMKAGQQWWGESLSPASNGYLPISAQLIRSEALALIFIFSEIKGRSRIDQPEYYSIQLLCLVQ